MDKRNFLQNVKDIRTISTNQNSFESQLIFLNFSIHVYVKSCKNNDKIESIQDRNS